MDAKATAQEAQPIKLCETHPPQIHQLPVPPDNRQLLADLILTKLPIITVVRNNRDPMAVPAP